MAYYDDLDRAHAWLMKQCEEYRTAERAAVIYDQQENKGESLSSHPTLYSREKIIIEA
jgi:hypothetical protein